MIKNLHKINDRVFFCSVILIIILLNLKYIDMPIFVTHCFATKDFLGRNQYYSTVQALRKEIKNHPDFYDEGKVGFISDLKDYNIFLKEETIKAFYTAQYAVVPSIVKSNFDEKYAIGTLYNKKNIPKDYAIVSQISENLFLLKRRGE